MTKEQYSFSYEVYDTIDDLPAADQYLLAAARSATKFAYAPYSQFLVGAVARLANGETITGSNQENASYPVGLCAERVLLSAASSLHPQVPLHTLAISYHNTNGASDRPISPCGICRQSLLEYEGRFGHPIRIILGGLQGKIFIIDRASMLLPLSFTADDMSV